MIVSADNVGRPSCSFASSVKKKFREVLLMLLMFVLVIFVSFMFYPKSLFYPKLGGFYPFIFKVGNAKTPEKSRQIRNFTHLPKVAKESRGFLLRCEPSDCRDKPGNPATLGHYATATSTRGNTQCHAASPATQADNPVPPWTPQDNGTAHSRPHGKLARASCGHRPSESTRRRVKRPICHRAAATTMPATTPRQQP